MSVEQLLSDNLETGELIEVIFHVLVKDNARLSVFMFTQSNVCVLILYFTTSVVLIQYF